MIVRQSQVQVAIFLLAIISALAPADTSAASGVRVILPDEPPRLTPAAAQALLRILLKARSQVQASALTVDRKDSP